VNDKEDNVFLGFIVEIETSLNLFRIVVTRAHIFCHYAHPERREGSPLTIERGDPSHSFRVTANQHRHPECNEGSPLVIYFLIQLSRKIS